MSLANFIKMHANKLPIGLRVGSVISKINYTNRPGIGSSYQNSVNEISIFNLKNDQINNLIFHRVKEIATYAVENTKFYREFYGDNQFNVNSLKNFNDLELIPIVTKSDLKSFDIRHITCMNRNDLQLSNTGGSTGKPFSFYITAGAMGHEWAHVHQVWSKLGFKPSDLKAIFAGRSTVKDHVDYDLIRHSLIVDIYSNFDEIANKLISFNKIKKIKYLHGYPSSLYEFACYCETNKELLSVLSESLKGVFLTSEYPHKYFRDKIENVFNVRTQSFYGHTERCIMAYENINPEEFLVLQSYGYCEVVNNELIGTAYQSYGTPLIRYATGDKVKEHSSENGVVTKFVLEEGRTGEFILDKYGKKIPLTALIFGRHHELFNYVSHIQVHQKEQGIVTILYCTDTELPKDVCQLFDSKNVNVDFRFLSVREPIKTVSGKFKLIVDHLPDDTP